MTCREFEDAMQAVFRHADETLVREAVTREDWHLLGSSPYVEHLTHCPDCPESLLQYLGIRNVVDYRSFPCFHVAYYSGDVPERCLEAVNGLYVIITDRARDEGIVIGYCPWCGVGLPVGIGVR